MRSLILLLHVIVLSSSYAFVVQRPLVSQRPSCNSQSPPASSAKGGRRLWLAAAISSDDDDDNHDEKQTGDKLRQATGIRPSLHPITINALADALKLRAVGDEPLVVGADGIEPLQVAMSAGKIATNALGRRRETSVQDGMELTQQEEQTVAGRVVGVVMRFAELETMLQERTAPVGWINKYNEWASFGVLKDESDARELKERIKMDPLFCMARAECLLALFLHTVEAPTLQRVGEDVPGGSSIDFIDADRLEVLLGDFQ